MYCLYENSMHRIEESLVGDGCDTVRLYKEEDDSNFVVWEKDIQRLEHFKVEYLEDQERVHLTKDLVLSKRGTSDVYGQYSLLVGQSAIYNKISKSISICDAHGSEIVLDVTKFAIENFFVRVAKSREKHNSLKSIQGGPSHEMYPTYSEDRDLTHKERKSIFNSAWAIAPYSYEEVSHLEGIWKKLSDGYTFKIEYNYEANTLMFSSSGMLIRKAGIPELESDEYEMIEPAAKEARAHVTERVKTKTPWDPYGGFYD